MSYYGDVADAAASLGSLSLSGSSVSFASTAAAAAAAAPLAPSEYLRRRVFFLIDRTACKNEEDPPQDMILYFYPPELALEHQLFLIGACSSMLEFARNFTNATVRVFTLDMAKMAVKQFGPYIAVLSADVSVPNHAVLADLELVHGAFTFFNGSVESVRRNDTNGNHQSFLSVMKKLGSDMIPFIRPSRTQPHPAFNPIIYTSLPQASTRFFLMASEILNAVKTEQDNLGGVVIYSEAPGVASVLCTHLEAHTTAYILTYVQAIFSESRGEPSMAESREDVTLVFMPTDELARLREGRTRVAQVDDDLREMLPDDYLTPSDEGEFVGLDFLFLQRIALATVMNLPARSKDWHRNKTKSLAQSKLMALETKLGKLNRTNPPRVVPEGAPLISAMSFDQSSHRLNVASLDPRPVLRDEKFQQASGTAHELFATNTDLRTVTLVDRDTTLFARREFEQEVFYYKRAPATTPGSATPSSSSKGQALYPRDMVGLEEAAKDAFPDLSLTML